MNDYILSISALAGLMAVLAVVLTIAEKLLVNYGICKINIIIVSKIQQSHFRRTKKEIYKLIYKRFIDI